MNKDEHEIVGTPSFGNVKYLEVGAENNEVILFITGGGAGFNSVYAFRWLASYGFRLVSINRPGYFDMSFNGIKGFQSHADLYFEVLQQIGIRDKIHVFGISMGGLSALWYAKKYPSKSLALWSAITGRYKVNHESANSVLGKLFLSEKGKAITSWILKRSVKYFPKLTVMAFLNTEADLTKAEKNRIANEVVKSPEDLRELRIFIESMTPMDKLYKGMMDEVKKATNLKEVDWSKIKCPTFVVHSTADIDVPIEHAKRLSEQIAHAKIKYVKAGGHFVWWGNEGQKVKEETKDFFIAQSTEPNS